MTLPTDAHAVEEQATSLRAAIRAWAVSNENVPQDELFAHLMNLVLQIAYALGSNPHTVAGQLHEMVDRSLELYGSLAGSNQKPS